MGTETSPKRPSRTAAFRNPVSTLGLIVVLGALFSFLLLFFLDVFAHVSNPYVGILTYMVAPAFGFFGAFLAVVGAVVRRRKMLKQVDAGEVVPLIAFDLTKPRDRKFLVYFFLGSAGFLLVSALGSYRTYHFTESVQFCGQACHTVMQPELVTYQHGPHARVSCVECHIGSGATWFVRSKLSGTYQVYAVAADKYPRPIPTPIKNLRPAQETCEKCHWPEKFVGNLDRTYSYFLADETNTYHEIRMLMKVGGADPTHGPVGGIHWHMNVANKIEYIATDPKRQTIPWFRLTDQQGVMTEFKVDSFTNDVSQFEIRVMDCMDCHNRPAHRYKSPNDAVNLAMGLGSIDPGIPWIKTKALEALTQDYTNETQALQGIATYLANQYTNDPRIRPVIEAVQQIYRDNFFPEMKARWDVYPDNIGHMEFPGCFRCHDDRHKSADGKKVLKGSECSVCHVILAQGTGEKLFQLNAKGQPFEHPGDELSPGDMCNDCHTGGP